MSDLDTAKGRLYEKELTLAVVKKGEVLFETSSPFFTTARVNSFSYSGEKR